MAKFEQFCAAVGYFRASGYFKLRKELEHVPAIRILIGINIDKIFKHHTNALSKQRTMFEGNDEDARSTYIDDFVNDINKDARYSEDVEDGIYQLLDDIQSGKVILKVHPKNNLHAKFYQRAYGRLGHHGGHPTSPNRDSASYSRRDMNSMSR